MLKSGEYMFTEVVSEIHIYHNKLEYFIKLLIWWACWLGGVWVLWASAEGVGSAFFVFALSQLMEFAPKILNKKFFWSRLCHGLFCMIITIVLLISMALLFSKEYNIGCHRAMNVMSLITMIYLSVDCFILMMEKEDKYINSKAELVFDMVAIEKFQESLHSGPLGNVEKGN